MKRSGTSEADFRTAANKKAGRQYRAVRWFLLPEGELRPRLGQGSGLQISRNEGSSQIANQLQRTID